MFCLTPTLSFAHLYGIAYTSHTKRLQRKFYHKIVESDCKVFFFKDVAIYRRNDTFRKCDFLVNGW